MGYSQYQQKHQETLAHHGQSISKQAGCARCRLKFNLTGVRNILWGHGNFKQKKLSWGMSSWICDTQRENASPASSCQACTFSLQQISKQMHGPRLLSGSWTGPSQTACHGHPTSTWKRKQLSNERPSGSCLGRHCKHQDRAISRCQDALPLLQCMDKAA